MPLCPKLLNVILWIDKLKILQFFIVFLLHSKGENCNCGFGFELKFCFSPTLTPHLFRYMRYCAQTNNSKSQQPE